VGRPLQRRDPFRRVGSTRSFSTCRVSGTPLARAMQSMVRAETRPSWIEARAVPHREDGGGAGGETYSGDVLGLEETLDTKFSSA